MTLLAPWALWFLTAAAAIVGLYLLKVRRERVVVPALEFWRQLVAQSPVRSLFQSLKRWLSLLLWLIIITALILALGNPIIALGRIQPRSIAIVLDNSASMQSVEDTDAGTTRLDEARAAITQLLNGRPVSDTWLLIEAASEPRVCQGWTRQKRAISGAANTLTPHFGTADLPAATALADQLLAGKERPTIVVVSDGGAGVVTELASADERIIHWPIGQRTDNIGITRLQARTHRALANHQAFVRLCNSADTDREIDVVFHIDNATAAVEPATIPAHGVWEKTVTLDAPDGGVLRVSVDANDALSADNEAFAILEPVTAAKILLVTPADSAFFFEQALLAMEPLVDAAGSHTADITRYNTGIEGAVDLTIFNGTAPESLPDTGRFIFVGAWPAQFPIRTIGTLDAPTLRLADRDHPLNEHLNLTAAAISSAKHVDLTGPATILATSSDGAPLTFLIQEPGRESLCLAFDVLASDLPFRNAFPMLLRNAVTNLVTERRGWLEPQYPIGALIAPTRQLPADVAQVQVAALNDAEVVEKTLPVRGGTFTYTGSEKAGPLRFTLGDEYAYTAINLASDNESRIAPIAPERPVAERLTLSSQWLGWPPWLALVAAALLLVGMEWLTYHYRWTE